MRVSFRGLITEPLAWAIHYDCFPEEFKKNTDLFPHIQFRQEFISCSHKAIHVVGHHLQRH